MAKQDNDAHLLLEYKGQNELNAHRMADLITSALAKKPEAILEEAKEILRDASRYEGLLRAASDRNQRPDARAPYKQAGKETKLATLNMVQSFLPILDGLAMVEPRKVVDFIEFNSMSLRAKEDSQVAAKQEDIESEFGPISAKALLAWKPDSMQEESWLISATRLASTMPLAQQEALLSHSAELRSVASPARMLKIQLQRVVRGPTESLSAG